MLIAHATDLSGDDKSAFIHASAIAAATLSRLLTVHADVQSADLRQDLPDASVLAQRWNKSIAHERHAYASTGDVVSTVIEALHGKALQLLVLGTHARHGASALLHPSVAESLARIVKVPALVVQNPVRGFVDAATGALHLRRILIPAGNTADASSALVAVRRVLVMLNAGDAELELVHVGGGVLERPDAPVIRVDGPVVDAIVQVARKREASLIVMATRGHDELADVVRGSHTERVIREADCPVLSVPHGWI